MNIRSLRVASVALAAVAFAACGKSDETAKVVDSTANATPSVAPTIDSIPLADSAKKPVDSAGVKKVGDSAAAAAVKQ